MMGQTAGIEKSTKCATAISTAFTIACFGADDNTMTMAVAVSNDMIGVFQHTTLAAGDEVRVMLTGISRIVLGGTVARGQLLTSNSLGRGVVATQHVHVENLAAAYTQNATTAAASAVRTIGRALASGVAGDIIPVLIAPGIA